MIDHPKAGRKVIFYNPVTKEWERGKILKGCRHGSWYTTVHVESESGVRYRMHLPFCFSITDGLAMILLHAGGARFRDICGTPDEVWRIVPPRFEKVR